MDRWDSFIRLAQDGGNSSGQRGWPAWRIESRIFPHWFDDTHHSATTTPLNLLKFLQVIRVNFYRLKTIMGYGDSIPL